MSDAELTAVLAQRLAAVESRIEAACQKVGRRREEVTLVAVTKTVSIRVVQLLTSLGVRELGENRPQELWKKASLFPTANWHLIGHLQRNKIEKTVPLVCRIHSVDSLRLLDALDGHGRSTQPVSILLEVNCSREANKGGFAPDALPELSASLAARTGVRIEGLMTMAAYHENPEFCRTTFAELRDCRDRLAQDTGLSMPHLSMGMSNDFPVAIEEGATLVRIGSSLFDGFDHE